MKQATVDILVTLFAYGGNGGVSSIIPDMAIWLVKAIIKLKADPRVKNVHWEVLSDTPITMTRNRAVEIAEERGCDMILMLDSDNMPDAYVGRDPDAKGFLDVAFPFAYDRLVKGLPTVMAAPYCGPPPHPVPPPGVTDHGEIPYLFQWSNTESHSEDCKFKIEILNRREASKLRGIYPMAALPTGVSLFTLNAFEGMKHPHFYYEFNERGSEKKSTEDVTCTRDISLFWMMTKGIEVVYAACDSWALHYKPKRVGKPNIITLEEIGERMREAVIENVTQTETIQYVDFDKGLPPGIKPEDVKMLPARGETAAQNFNRKLGLPDDHGQPVIVTDEPKLTIKSPSNWPGNTIHEKESLDIAARHVDPSKLKRRWEHLGPEDDFIYVSDEEWKQLEQVALLEANNDAQASSTIIEQAIRDEEDTDIDDDEYDVAGDPLVDEKQNGHGIRHKTVGGHKVAILRYEVPDNDLTHVRSLVNWVAEKKGRTPIDVAVLHPGTGQSTAAILADLPEGSRLYALDNTMVYQFSGEPAKHFTTSFAAELESGAVKASVGGRRFPEDVFDTDMVFIERFAKREHLDKWLPHVTPGGVIAGLGYQDKETRSLIQAFKEDNDLPVLQTEGDVWAIPVKHA